MTPKIRKLAWASSIALGTLSVGAVGVGTALAVLVADRVPERLDAR